MEESSKVLKFFNEISAIPRMSGKEDRIADYVEKFAKNRNLNYIRDSYNNVIIFKEATDSKKTSESIILQCHIDMVCEKEEFSDHDFETDPLELYIDGDFIKAKNTTLGADNGIGMAIILSILDSNEIKHPRIEAVFTVQEETTMYGAKMIDTSVLTGNKMICLDNMNEEELWIGCASAKIFEYSLNGNEISIPPEYCMVEVCINGFMGGHSGKDIGKQRGNPIEEMGKLLEHLSQKYHVMLCSLRGGYEVNVIPRECYANIIVEKEKLQNIEEDIVLFEENMRIRILSDYEDINISFQRCDKALEKCLDLDSSRRIINLIHRIPNGVFFENRQKNPLVSLNIGRIELMGDKFILAFSIRSNMQRIEEKLLEQLNDIEKQFNIKKQTRELAGYEHRSKSKFINECKNIYEKCFYRKPRIIKMHICLEAGFFATKIKNLDYVAISPNIFDPHSPKERCSISSLKKVYSYIIAILEQI